MNSKSIISKVQRNYINLTSRIRSILIGMILSDGWIQVRKGWNPRIGIKQSMINFDYFWTLFKEISVQCSGYPWICKAVKRGKIFYAVEINTRQQVCLKEIHTLFFLNGTRKLIQIGLYDYLDYIVLAHWIMGDGSKKNDGITQCTDNFTMEEVVQLISMQGHKFNISPTMHTEKNKYYRIYINGNDLRSIRPYLLPYFVDSMKYKLHQ